MPTICEFFGIIIRMYYNDENPPHFHAVYGEFEIRVEINNLKIIDGDFPSKQINMVLRWAKQHHNELKEEWKRIEKKEPLFKIEPLK